MGIGVAGTIVIAYTLSGLMAGLGGGFDVRAPQRRPLHYGG
jgi:ABC-type uncharacterized transport system permease subunit